MENAVEIKNVTKSYRVFDKEYEVLKWLISKRNIGHKKLVLDDISFKVKHGENIGIIGKNASGKSTIMKLLAQITFPDSGEIVTRGRVTAFINLGAGFNVELTGRENIYYKAQLMGVEKKHVNELMPQIEKLADIGEYMDIPMKKFSSGMRARLGFALAINLDPDIILLDEVLAVGDKKFKKISSEKIQELFSTGKTIFFSSHEDDLIRQFCTRVIYIRNGKIVYDGDVEEGLKRYNDQEVYDE
ncbi:MAG: ABC transporter ATP-binding protein [Eubacteriales bacterium]